MPVGFSAHTRKTANSKADDCSLLEEFSRLIREGRPDIVSMKNVSGLRRHDAFQDFLLTLAELGYDTKHSMLSCDTGHFGHPEEDRAISLREGALLQTFPRDDALGLLDGLGIKHA